MRAQCKDNSGFEDKLSSNKSYHAIELKNNSVRIMNDAGQKRWYGIQNFRITLNG